MRPSCCGHVAVPWSPYTGLSSQPVVLLPAKTAASCSPAMAAHATTSCCPAGPRGAGKERSRAHSSVLFARNLKGTIRPASEHCFRHFAVIGAAFAFLSLLVSPVATPGAGGGVAHAAPAVPLPTPAAGYPGRRFASRAL